MIISLTSKKVNGFTTFCPSSPHAVSSTPYCVPRSSSFHPLFALSLFLSLSIALLARTNANPQLRETDLHQKKDNHKGCPFLVYPIGFEPTTPSVGGWCSIQLSYGYALFFCFFSQKHLYFTIFHFLFASIYAILFSNSENFCRLRKKDWCGLCRKLSLSV